MPYFRVDDNFGNHPKVVAIPRRDRLACIGLWSLAGSWCARHLTDGRLAAHMLEEFGATKKHADLLVKAGLWETTSDGYAFHDWLSWQGVSREDVLVKREKEAERKRKWREAKDAKKSGTDERVPDMSQRDNTGTDNGTGASVRAESALTHPLPIHYPSTTPLSYGERDQWLPREGDAAEADARASNDPLPPEPPLCRRHTGMDRDSVPPCTACGRLRQQWQHDRDQTDRPPPLPPLCGQCENRMIDNDDGTVSRCPRCHPAMLGALVPDRRAPSWEL